jgi:hypothetical protein
MKDIFESSFTRNLSALCLMAAPLCLLISSSMGISSESMTYPKYVFGKAGIALFVFAIFALVQMLRPQMEKLAIIGGGMAIIGAISGTTLISFLYYYNQSQGIGFDAAALQQSNNLLKQVYMTMVFVPLPGLFFPIGLVMLSVGLFIKKVIPRSAAVILAVGAITFPMGRIPQNGTIFIITDALFLISLAPVAWQVFSSGSAQESRMSYAKA